MRILVACESSGVVRESFRKRGHDAVSVDLLPSDDGSCHHIQADVLEVLYLGWEMMIAHPPCTRLTNSGVRWLHVPPSGRTIEEMWQELREAATFYRRLRDAAIPRKAIENPVMHGHAKELIGFFDNRGWVIERQIVQPWWFGEPQFKATGWELHGLPKLVPTNKLIPPLKGTAEHKAWSKVHRASPGPNRWKERSRTLQGPADAMAQQWG